MSNSRKHKTPQAPAPYDSGSLWHVSGDHSLSLGCQSCFYRSMCGGLEIQASLYDCIDFCRCEDRTTCDNVCPNNAATLAARLQEVRGLKLDNVDRAPRIDVQPFPKSIPLIHHGSARTQPFRAYAVALPLEQLVDYPRGRVRFSTREALLDKFRLSEDCQIVLSGTDQDQALEKWWRLEDRRAAVRDLIGLGVVAMTAPNYSLFGDVPRTDNLYNMKRIALTWSEVQQEGLSCALHLNARTDHDWMRWVDFLQRYPEIDLVAAEFGTGAGYKRRIEWHVTQLRQIARHVARPLHLIVRGGVHVLSLLSEDFAAVSLIDTRPFVKTHRRQRAVIIKGRLRWQRWPTQPGEPLDDLLRENAETVATSISLSQPTPISTSSLIRRFQNSCAANDTSDKPLQFCLLKQPSLEERGSRPVDRQSMVSAAKPELAIEIGQPNK